MMTVACCPNIGEGPVLGLDSSTVLQCSLNPLGKFDWSVDA